MIARTIPWLLVCLLLFGVAAAEDNAAPPGIEEPPVETFDPEAELERLAPYLEDEAEAVRAVRQFDRLQQRFAAWDDELAEQYAAEGDMDLARMALERGRTRMETVLTAYEQILERYPDNAVALNFSGEVHYDWLQNQGRALEAWHRSRELDDQLAAPRNNLAIHYCHVGEYKDCLSLFDEAMELEPDNPDYLFNLAQIFLIHPRHVEAHYGIEGPEVYERAMEMSRKASELKPNDFSLAQDYAVNYFAGERFGVQVDWGDAAKAWQATRRTVSRSDELFYTWLNEGRVWLRADNGDEAARCFREALEIIPGNDVAQRLLERAEAAG